MLLIEALVLCCFYSAWFSVFLTSKKYFGFGWVFFFFLSLLLLQDPDFLEIMYVEQKETILRVNK